MPNHDPRVRKMALRFTVLASGSSGNASLIEAGGFGLLLDGGLGPRTLGERLQAVGASWNNVHAMLLTHTHTDHWQDRTLGHLHRRRLPLYCHPDHVPYLARYSGAFADLQASGLVRFFQSFEDLRFGPTLRCRPVPVRHDSGATFAFRFDGPRDLFGHCQSLGFLTDLGTWNEDLLDHFTDLDVLAVEFNHDVEMEYRSGRPHHLVARVLGDEGHLSNEQAAELLRAVLGRSTPGKLRHVVQLHLSRDCNRPSVAAMAARIAVSHLESPPEVHTSCQHEPGPTLTLDFSKNGLRIAKRKPSSRRRTSTAVQTWLPGLEID